MIGVACAESGKARDDVGLGGRAASARLGRPRWCGRSPPCRTATRRRPSCARWRTSPPARRSRSSSSRAAGARSPTCCVLRDQTLCRTVALLRVPVIASVGHHTDRTLIDDDVPLFVLDAHARRRGRPCRSTTAAGVEPAAAAARSTARPCSLRSGARTWTSRRAARPPRRAAPPCARVQTSISRRAAERLGRRAIVERARALARLSRAPAEHVARHRTWLHQQLGELRERAAGRRPRARAVDDAVCVYRRAAATTLSGGARRPRPGGRACARPRVGRGAGALAPSPAPHWRSPRTIRRARWSAATRWSTTA